MAKIALIQEIKNALGADAPSMTFWSEEKVKEYHSKVVRSEENYGSIDIDTISFIDLLNKKYHGGTTLSSGALPKWDLEDGKYMVKRCGIDSYGRLLTDYANEELIYRFCEGVGIKAAKYRAIRIKYFDEELSKEIETPAVITEIFSDSLVHYRDIRRRFNFGKDNDEIIDFTDKFQVSQELNDLLLVDYLFNQQDRHSKNIGMIGDKLSPIFDSGSSLFFDILESQLNEGLYDKVPRHKTFGKALHEQLKFSLQYIDNGFTVAFDGKLFLSKFESALGSMANHYSARRSEFVLGLVKRRLTEVGQILSKTQRRNGVRRYFGNKHQR